MKKDNPVLKARAEAAGKGPSAVSERGNDLRRRAERRLREQAQIIDQIHDSVIATDLDGYVTMWNKGSEKAFGYAAEEALGQHISFIYSPDQHEFLEQQLIKPLLEKGQHETEVRVRRKSGDEFYAQLSLSILRNEEGTVTGMIGYSLDLSDRKRTEQALEATRAKATEEKNRLVALMEALPVGLCILDAQGGIIQCNPAFETIWGGPRPQTRNVSDYASYKAWWVETGKPVQPEEWASARVVQKGETHVGQLMEIERFDGTRIFIMNSGAPIRNADGDIVGCAVTIQDITDLRKTEQALQESEQRYRGLVEVLPDPIVVHTDGRFVYVNPATLKLYGATQEGDLLGRPVHDLIRSDERKAIAESFDQIQEGTKTAIPVRETCILRLDGVERDVEVTAVRASYQGQTAVQAVLRDITERKQIEAELTRLASFPQLNPNPVVEVDLAGHVHYSNPAAERLFPDLKESGFNHPWLTDLEKTAQRSETEVKSTHVREVRVGDHWYQQTVHPVMEGTRLRMYGFDITKRKHAEEELRQGQKDLDRAQEVGQIGSWRLDVQQNVLTWSDENHRIFRIPKGTPMTYETFLSTVHPDDREYVDAKWKAGLAGKPYDIEHRIVVDGQIKWVREKAYLEFDKNGKLLGGFGITQDITDRRRAEDALEKSREELEVRVRERTQELTSAVEALQNEVAERIEAETSLKEREALLRTVFETLPVGVWITDKEGHITHGNQAGQQIWAGVRYVGIDQFNEYKGWWLDNGKQIEPEEWAVARAISWGETSVNEEIEIECFDGSRKIILNSAAPIRDDNHQILGAFVVNQDITERKQMEKQQAILQNHLRQVQKMEALGTLAGGIAHDFNNILMPIVMNTELALLDIDKESPAANSLQLVLNAASRGKEMVRQIIAFSRMKERERSPIRISSVVKEALKLLRSSLPKHIEVRVQITAESAMVSSDPTQIHQILINICNNASQAMQEKGGVLQVDLEEVEVDKEMASLNPDLKPGPYVVLRVDDTGHGMTPEVMEKAFDPFFTTKDPSEGTGMGLAVVHGIVKSHGGAITVISEAGKGSSFSVYLPRIQEEEEGKKVDPDELPKGFERILIVDDEAAQVVSLRNMLGRLGYRVTERKSSLDALELFRAKSEDFDLVITDEMMPGMTGSKLAKELLQLRPNLPIILCTGFSERIDGDTVKAIGIRELMMKPFGIRELAQTIRKVLDAGS
jgi:PAS domain S-box-containing protein